ncbi:MAG: hypothetical protein M3433_02190 [Actinomycetota bacterium]|nr:hypothetical protein [Actinomycetota bacterium]
MPLTNKLSRFARSTQGRKVAQRAQRYASSPKGQRKIREVRSRLMKRS